MQAAIRGADLLDPLTATDSSILPNPNCVLPYLKQRLPPHCAAGLLATGLNTTVSSQIPVCHAIDLWDRLPPNRPVWRVAMPQVFWNWAKNPEQPQ